MKYTVLSMIIFLFFATSLKASDTEPQVEYSFQIYPKEIHYGDPFFARLTVQNPEERTINVILPHYYGTPTGTLFSGNDAVYHWLTQDALNYAGGAFTQALRGHSTRYLLLKPKQERVIYFYICWMPVPDHPADKEADNLRKLLKDTGETFDFKMELPLRAGYNMGTTDKGDIWETMPKEDIVCQVNSEILIKPRPEGDLSLVHDWFLEFPSPFSGCDLDWTPFNVFAHVSYVRDSPFNVQAETPDEYRTKRWPLMEKMSEFCILMQNRTAEALARIERTNALAAQIIERSKQPDSTFSQNMVEFIQLRGLLVDMRYAENAEAEESAFEKLMNFVDKTQDRKLWVDLVYEIGLLCIMDDEFFTWEKLEHYRKQFAERFEIQQLGLME